MIVHLSTNSVHEPCGPVCDYTNPALDFTTEGSCSTTFNNSFLWAQLTDDEKYVCLGDDPVEIEKLHGVRPQGKQPRRKEVDPMKAKVSVAGHSLRTIQGEYNLILTHELLRFR